VANFISSEISDKTILRYDLLFEEGLSFAQKYSGKIWTDYNYHDPGVTFLEYFCYALTDLGYRTKFPIQDIFLFDRENTDPVKDNLLFGPETVFSTSPVTINDYRKLIIDRVKHVANAWVVPLVDNKLGVQGLFDIFIESGEDFSDLELDFLKNEVALVFHANRMVGHDLDKVHILKKVNISLTGDILIEEDVLAEFVISKIYASLDKYINPFVELHDPIKLWKEMSMPPEAVFNGPLPRYGYIFETDLSPKVEAIYLTRIKEIILDVEGVKEVRNLGLFKNGIPVFETFVNFKKDEFPKIQYLDELTEALDSNLKIYKNNVSYDVDGVITKQLIATELLSRNKFYHHRFSYTQKLPQGRFSQKALQQHYPIHDDMPDFFGVGKIGVSKSSSKEEQASVLQVSAYLYFFEQFMASYLAQLANVRHLFSVSDIKNTYFNQVPEGITKLKDLLKDYPGFQEFLDDYSQSNDDFFDRRNRVLDQLLARFGERLDVSSLKKLSSANNLKTGQDISSEIIESKVKLLKSIVDLGHDKAKAFDIYAMAIWDSDNVSGLEKRLAATLNIKNIKRRYIAAPLLKSLGLSTQKKSEKIWELAEVELIQHKIQAYRLPKEAYKDGQAHFMGKGFSFFPELFEVLSNEKAIYYGISKDKTQHYLFMQQKRAETPFVLFESDLKEDCIQAKAKLLEKLLRLNDDSEGFHMIEHILLRPMESVSYLFSFFDLKGEVFLEGLQMGDLEEQKSLGEDVVIYGVEINNYTISEDEESNTFSVILFNNNHEGIGRLFKQFNSRPGAKKAIDDAIVLFQKIEKKELSLDTVFEVNHVAGSGHGFPPDFEFSHTNSWIFPDWPNRFSKADFAKFIKQFIAENVIAHQDFKVYFLNVMELYRFEEVYHQWLKLKNASNPDLKKIDILSLQIIQMLMGLKPMS
jgi:hypothetical protein